MTKSIHFIGQLFLCFLCLKICIQAYLDKRQRYYVDDYRDEVPEDFEAVVPLDSHQKAADYTLAKLKAGKIVRNFHMIILGLWTIGGGLEWLTQKVLWFEQTYPWLQDSPIMQGLLLITLFSGIELLLGLPESLYFTFILEQKFGFNRTTFKTFILDMLKGLVLSALIGMPFMALLLLLITKFHDSWWWMGFLALAIFQIVLMWAYPTFIAPLFNKFSPLEDERFKSEIEKLLEKTHLTSKGLFVMDASRRTNHGNAYFTGFGSAKRIVFFDTLLKDLTPGEVCAILAHEIGHYKRKHILKGLILGLVMTFLGFFILGQLSTWPPFYNGHGLKTVTPAGMLLLFSLITGPYTFFLTPLMNKLSRKHEYEADAYACEYAQKEDLISGLIKLYKENASTLTPDPSYSAFYYSHPPATERIKAMRSHQKENQA